MHFLLLASASKGRQELLQVARIPFTVIKHVSNESMSNESELSFDDLVKEIAVHKMEHVVIPDSKDVDCCFILTADTLCQDARGNRFGKPSSKDDAISMINAFRRHGGLTVATGFCVDKRVLHKGVWETKARIAKVVKADIELVIPESLLEQFFEEGLCLSCAGALSIEGYAAQFFKTIKGSYTTVIGLPLFEVREALQEIGFYPLV